MVGEGRIEAEWAATYTVGGGDAAEIENEAIRVAHNFFEEVFSVQIVSCEREMRTLDTRETAWWSAEVRATGSGHETTF